MKRIAFIVVLAVVLVLTCGLVACNEKDALALPEYELPELAAVYGQTLSDIPLPPGFSWVEDPTTSVGNAGTAVFHLTYTPTDTDTYQTVTDIEIVIPVSKGTTTASFDATVNATYGQTLSDLALPAGFRWEDEASVSVGEIGDHVFNVTFTPTDTNYNDVTGIPVTVSVGKGTYDMSGITFENATFTYDGGMKSIAIRGTLPDGVTVRYENDTRVNAGSNTVTAVFSGDFVHYNDIPNLTATLTINKKNIVITANSAESVYGQSLVPLTATADLAMGDAEADVFTLEKAEGLNVGTYAITVTVVPNDNYNVTETVSATYTIQKATYDMSGVFFGNGQFTYDGTAKSLAIQDALPDGVTVEYEGNEQVNADTYTVTAHFTGDAENYNLIEDKTATLTILQAEIEGLSFVDASFTYDGSSRTLEVEGMPQGASVSYVLNGEAFSSAINAGSYEITATVSVSNPNYKKAELTATLVIAPKQITITGDTIRSTYGEDLLPLTATVAEGIVTGDDPASIYTLSKEAGTNAGIYDIIVTLVDNVNPNYTVYQVINGSYIIDKATYDMSSVTFEDKEYTYDGDVHTITVGGTLPEGVTVRYANNSRVNAGSMEVSAIFVGDYDNYCLITPMTARLTVKKASAFLNSDNMVNTFTYDGKEHKIEGLTASGKIGVFPGYTFVTAPTGQAVSIYVAESENYESDTFEKFIFINPKELTATMSNVTVAYGESLPTFPFSITGYVNGEDQSVFSGALYASADYVCGVDGVGEYTIGLQYNEPENYIVTVNTATLTVVKADPTLIVTAISKAYDNAPANVSVETDSDGAVTYLYKNKDADDSTYSETVPVGGGYYTVKAILEEGANYNSATATADFYITHKDIPRVVIETYSGTYGTPLEDPEFSILNSADMDITQSLHCTIEYKKEDEGDSAYTTEKPVNAGRYVVRVTSEANANFEGAVGTKPFIMKSQELDGNLKVTEVHAPLGVLIKDVPLPEHWSWQEPLDVRVGDEEAHYATYSGDPNYHAYPWVVIHPDAELQIYLADPDMTIGDVLDLSDDWVYDETKKIAELQVYSMQDDYTIVSFSATGKELNSMGTYDERLFFIKLVKYLPTLTFTGSLNTECFNNKANTHIGVPEEEYDSRLSLGATPASTTILFGGKDILAKTTNSVDAVFISAEDYTGLNQASSEFSLYHPQLPGNYVCRIRVVGTTFRQESFLDIPFTISKAQATLTFTEENSTQYVVVGADDVPYVVAIRSHNDGEQTRIYSYRSCGADGIFDTEDDGEWTGTKPTQVGKYQIRCYMAESTYSSEATAVTEFTLVKKERDESDAYFLNGDRANVYLGSADKCFVVFTEDEVSSSLLVYEYKPEGAADSLYTTTRPKMAGTYDVRVTIPETDVLAVSYLYGKITFHMYKANSFYRGTYMGDDLTFVFARTGNESGRSNMYYVFEGKHNILECSTLEYVYVSEDLDVDEIDSGLVYYCYDFSLMLELTADPSAGFVELIPMRLGTPLYVYNALYQFDYGDEPLPVTLTFNVVDGMRRVFVYNGTYTLAEIEEQGADLQFYYLNEWCNTIQADIIYFESKEFGLVWLRIPEDGKALERAYGDVVYVVQEEVEFNDDPFIGVKGVKGAKGKDGENGETRIQTLVFYNFMGERYVLTYPGAYTKETISTAPAVLSEYYEWFYEEGAECVICEKEKGDYVYLVEEDGSLTLSLTFDINNDRFYGYVYYYDVWEDGSGEEVVCTFSVFMYADDADIFIEPWKDGVPAKPVTFAEYEVILENSFSSECLGDRMYERSETSGNRREYRLKTTGATIYKVSEYQFSLRGSVVDEWYSMPSSEDDDIATTWLFWRSGSEVHCALVQGRYYDETVLRAAFRENSKDTYSWAVEDGYLYLYVQSTVKASFGEKKFKMMFAVVGQHTLAEVPLGDCAYVVCQNEGDEADPYWNTYLFYNFGKEKCAFTFWGVRPEEITGYETVNELLDRTSAKQWSEDEDYVYFSLFGRTEVFEKGENGVLNPAPPTVEYLFVYEDDDETIAYLMYGNRGVAYVYDGIYSTAAELEQHGVGVYDDYLGTWESVTDGTDTYIFKTKNDTLTVRKVLEDNGTVTFESSMEIYGARLYYYNEIYDGGYYNGTFVFMDLGGRMIVYFVKYDEPLTPENEATNEVGDSNVFGYGKVVEARGVIQIVSADGDVEYEYDPVSGTLFDEEYIPIVPYYYALIGEGEYILFAETMEGERCVSFMLGEADSLEGVAALPMDMFLLYNWTYVNEEHTLLTFGGDTQMNIVPLLGGRLPVYAD